MALKKYGTNDLTSIQKDLPEKTITEIRFTLEKYAKLASNRSDREEKMREDDSAINQWIKFLKKSNDTKNNRVNMMPRILKYIALFEKRPHDKDVNLRYLWLNKLISEYYDTDLLF